MLNEVAKYVEDLLLDVHGSRPVAKLPCRRFELESLEAEHCRHPLIFSFRRESHRDGRLARQGRGSLFLAHRP